jgi:hypothetical protein
VRLLVSDRHGARTIAAARVVAGDTPPPGARIVSPTDRYRYVAGRVVDLRATARDPEEGRLRGRALRWQVVLRHAGHNHYVADGFGREFSFRPLRDHDADSYYKVLVAAFDRYGLPQLQPPHEISLRPKTTKISLDSQPAGAPIAYGAEELHAPVVRRAAVGHRTTVTAAATFESDGVAYEFSSWSDGGSRRRRIDIGPRPSHLTALYRQAE